MNRLLRAFGPAPGTLPEARRVAGIEALAQHMSWGGAAPAGLVLLSGWRLQARRPLSVRHAPYVGEPAAIFLASGHPAIDGVSWQ